MRNKKVILITIGSLILVFSLWILFFYVPHQFIDARYNLLGAGIEEMKPLKIPALHAQLRIADLHSDALMWDRDILNRATRGHVDLPRLAEGNIAIQVFSIVTKSPRGLNYESNSAETDNITPLSIVQRWPWRTWFSLHERSLYQIKKLKDAVARSGGKLHLLKSRQDLGHFLNQRQNHPSIVGGLLAIEGAHSLEGNLANLDELEREGVTILSPAHMFDSDLSGSQQGINRKGLSPLGREWLKKMDQKRLIIDLAHLSNSAIDDVLTLSQRPQIVSHTGVKGTCDMNRNLSDEHLKKISEKGGLIGVGFWDDAVCGKNLQAVVKSIKHVLQIAGIDHVALGSDWDGSTYTPIDASQIGWLTNRLVENGLSESEIRKIMGENTIRFLMENLP